MRPKGIDMTKISVIIPIYNAESFLNECLVSIQEQTFSDYEAWLIDDGSTDNSGTICDNFAANNKLFHVIHKKNGGVSSARNAGLEKVNGEWICFIDADDTVEKEYLSTLYQFANMQKDILIIQGFKTFLPDNTYIDKRFTNQLYNSSEIYKTFQDLNINRCGYPFGKLYNAEIIRHHHLRFVESIHYAEDVMFMLTYLTHCSAIQTVEGMNYNYYIRKNIQSLSKRIFVFESEYACYQLYLKRIGELKQRFNLTETSLRKVYNVISEYLIRRSIGALYQKQTRKPRQERLIILKRLTPTQLDFLHTYYKECSWFHKLTVWLLRKHYYYLCDVFNCLIAQGRSIVK